MKVVFLGFAILALLLGSGCNSAQSRMERGDTLFLRRKFSLVLEQYRTAQLKDPALIGIGNKIRNAETRPYLQREDETFQRSQWDVAERCYNEVRRLDPTNTEIDSRPLNPSIAQLSQGNAR